MSWICLSAEIAVGKSFLKVLFHSWSEFVKGCFCAISSDMVPNPGERFNLWTSPLLCQEIEPGSPQQIPELGDDMLNKKVCPEILQVTLPGLGWNPRALTTTPDPNQQTSLCVCVPVLMCLCQPSWWVKTLFLGRGVTELEGLGDMVKLQHKKFRLDNRKNFFPRYLEKEQISFFWDFQSLSRKSHSSTDVFKHWSGWDLHFSSLQKFYYSTKSLTSLESLPSFSLQNNPQPDFQASTSKKTNK